MSEHVSGLTLIAMCLTFLAVLGIFGRNEGQDQWQLGAVSRGYGEICQTGEFAWKGECDD